MSVFFPQCVKLFLVSGQLALTSSRWCAMHSSPKSLIISQQSNNEIFYHLEKKNLLGAAVQLIKWLQCKEIKYKLSESGWMSFRRKSCC